MADPKWSDDAFLDDLRRQADPLADSTVARLADEHGLQSLNTLFPRLLTDVDLDVEEIPGPAREFFETTRRRCGDFDSERLERGAFAFRGHAFAAAIVMLASSLPSGYAAPCLARILTVSGNLQNHPFRRLMGVLQLVVQVMAKGSSAAESQAHLTARKLRLLHAGIRRIVPRFRPEYIDRFGPPVNHEDMLATVMGFSHLVVEGIQKLGRHLSEDEADDIWYLWRYFCLDMGIHPEGRPDDPSLIPESRDDAAAFYRSYARRHFAGAAENPDGVELARINLDMMEAMIPAWKRGIG
ncbi:MAG: oxygenase MpaB family protein, partial [Acidobacteriota bacterium]